MRWLLLVLALALSSLAEEPSWSERAVWYQIFPERFCNADPGNDPRLIDQQGAWPHDHTSAWQVHPWTSDWYQLQPYEQANGKDLWFNLQRRRYGGDLQGILDKLDYLEDLGINALYLNPIFIAPSQHKYDAALYHHVDPTFGPDPEGDRKLIATENPADPSTWKWTAADRLALKLVKECHRRGMRVVFDGVFNHIGQTSPFFLDVVEKQQKSPYADWFTVTSWAPNFKYEGWFGVKELPEWREDEQGIVKGPRDYIFAVTRRWMAPEGRVEDGVDGWRLDVAFCVKHAFWKDWSRLVRSINPQAYLTAEVIDTVEANRPYLEGDEFSAVMNYNFAFATSEFFIRERDRISAMRLDELLRELREAYPGRTAYRMQNLVGSHDTARVASHIVNRQKLDYRDWARYCEASRATNREWDTRGPNADEKNTQKLLATFQMTYLGAPMVYYGDEAGMWGANDPDDRKPMVWDGPCYEPEKTNPDGTSRVPADTVAFDRDLFEHYRRLIALRKGSEALQTGDFETVVADDDLYGFLRTAGNERVLVLFNVGRKARSFKLDRDYTEHLSNRRVAGSILLAPRSAAVLTPSQIN